jgi:hypothetical protein
VSPSELPLAHEEAVLSASRIIAGALFGTASPAEYELRTPKQTVVLPVGVADDLVRDLALISVAPSRPAHAWRDSPSRGSGLTSDLLGDWGTSPLDPDPLPDDLLEPDNLLDQPDALERALDHLERLRDLAERHLSEHSKAAIAALTRVRGLFLDAFPSEASNIGKPRSLRRGAWLREAADLIHRAVQASVAEEPSAPAALNADELGHLLARLLGALSPETDPADPTSIARVLRKPS